MGRRERGSPVMRVCGQTGERVFCNEGVGRRERGSFVMRVCGADGREGLL